MTPLRKAMIEAMQVRGFSVRTHASYLSAVTDLACYYHRPPDKLTNEQLQAYFLYLATDRALSGSSCRLYLNAIRFFYLQVLQWSEFAVQLQVPKKAQRIPELLTRNEVTRIILACTNGKHRMLLTTCYGCGLRVSEVVALKVRHIDGERHLLRVEPGKGAKDRHVLISQTLLNSLRCYWQRYRPTVYLFPGKEPDTPLTITSAQKAFQKAKALAGIEKIGGIHSMRHAYATH
jgi:integrase/recombinase XerD